MTQNRGNVTMTASTGDSMRIGLRPKRSDIQPEANSASSKLIMLMA
jgi:hypothetical protein